MTLKELQNKSTEHEKQRHCAMNIPNAATGGVLKTFCKIHRKTPVLVSFLIKLQAEACNFIKEETLGQVFFCQFCEIPVNFEIIK